MICPNFSDPAVREKFDKIAALKGQDAAYNLWYLYDGEVPESEYQLSKDEIADEILSELPKVFQIGSSVLNLKREPQDIDFISIGSDQDILDWLDSNNIEYNNTGIDVSFNYKGQNVSIALEEQTKNFLNNIGVQDINQFIEPNRKLVNLTLEYKRAFGRDKDLQDIEEHYGNQDISFKPKPLNTISYLKQAELKGAIKVGSKFTFSYWDEENERIDKYEDVTVKDIDLHKITVELEDNTIKEFDLSNVIDDQIEGYLSFKEREILRKRLIPGDEEEVLLDSGRVKGIVIAVGRDGFVLRDASTGENINIKYSDIKRENHQIKFLQKVQEVKEAINKQILIYGGKVRTEEQKARLDSLQNAYSVIEDAQQLEDLREFFEIINENIINTQGLILSLDEKDITPARKLYVIGYAKDFLDSFDSVYDLNNLIQKYDGMQELKNVSAAFVSNIEDAKLDYYNVAIPQLADLLWEEFNPSINEELRKLNKSIWTKERLIEELKNPTRDLDSFNKFFVAPINSDDAITALFAKMIKRRKEIARAQDEMYLRKLIPVVKAVKNNFDYDEVVKSFYKLSTIVEEVDGEKREKTVRKFIEQYNTSDYKNTLNNFYQEIEILNNKVSQLFQAGKFDEANKLKAVRDRKQAEKSAYVKEFGKKVNAADFKIEMENYRNFDSPKFYKYLDYYYEKVEEEDHNPNSIVLESKLSGEKAYYNYKDNRWTANKDKFQTEEYKELMQKDPLIVKLYTIIKDEYDKANRMIPFSYRLNGVVPSMYETNALNSIKKSFENLWQSNEKQYTSKLDGKAYKEIPIGFTKVLDISESSDDIVTSTLMFIAEANNYNAMHEYLGATDTIVEILAKGNPLDETQKKVVRSEFNNRLDAVKKFINQIMYGEQNAYNNVMSKSIDALGKATAITRLGLNPLNWAQNFLIGNLTNYSEAFGGRHFNRKNLAWANKEFIRLQATNPQKLANMIRSLDAIQGRFLKNFGDELLTFKEKYISSDVLFLGQDMGEIQIQGTTMLALLKAKGIQIPEDGNFDMDKIPRDFVNLLHAINKHNHGVYNNFDRLYAQDNAVFRLFLQFRKFIVPTFRARYSGILDGKYRIDYESGTVEKGYYRLFYEYIRDSLKNFKDLKGMIADFNSLSDVQKEGVRRTFVDLAAFFTMYVLVAMLKPGDDDDEELANWEWQIIYQAARLRGDIGNYIPILGLRDQLRIVNNPFAAAPLINNVLSLLGQVGDWEPDKEGNISIFKRYQRDTGMYEKGDLKILGKLEKVNPFDNPLRVLYPKTMLENFEAASQK